jgi:hypothetical protein
MRLLPIFTLMILLAPAARADNCSYCTKLTEIQNGFAQTKPDPANDKTMDRQLELVNETEELVTKVLAGKKEPATDDWGRLIPLLATAAAYDYDNTLAEDVSSALGAREKKLTSEIERLKQAGTLTDKQFEALSVSYGTAEHTNAHGTDHDPSAKKND